MGAYQSTPHPHYTLPALFIVSKYFFIGESSKRYHKCYFSMSLPTEQDWDTNFLIPEVIHQMPPSLPYGAQVPWSSIFFFPIKLLQPHNQGNPLGSQPQG